MRRVLIFAALLSLLGLTTAFAASFDVQSEDIASFTTDVSISVPTTLPPQPTPVGALYLSGLPTDLPGPFSPVAASDTNYVQAKTILPSSGSVQSQTDPTKYHSWQIAAPAGGLSLTGFARLVVTQVGTPGLLRAAVFDCAAGTGPTSETCIQFLGDNDGVEGSNVTTVSFGAVSRTILSGRLLRVQIMNASTNQWAVQWGYKQNRQSRFEVTAQP